jgi:hypothetical protein
VIVDSEEQHVAVIVYAIKKAIPGSAMALPFFGPTKQYPVCGLEACVQAVARLGGLALDRQETDTGIQMAALMPRQKRPTRRTGRGPEESRNCP